MPSENVVRIILVTLKKPAEGRPPQPVFCFISRVCFYSTRENSLRE